MPTDLPIRKAPQPEPSAAGTLACAAAILLMLLISCAALVLHPDGATLAADPQGQAAG